MKHILITLFIAFSTFQMYGQNNGGERIKALKTAFITDKLDLTSKEAEKFWPIYNVYAKKVHSIKNLKSRELLRKVNGGIENISDIEASKLLEEFIEIDINVANAKKKLYKNLNGVIPPKKLIKLFKAEQDFNKELLRKLRDRRKEMIQNKNGN